MSFLQGVETGSNLYSRSVVNAATTQRAVFDALEQPIRMQQEEAQLERAVADTAMHGIRIQSERDAISDNVAMAEAMHRLEKGEDVSPNLKTAGAMQQWSQLKSSSLLGRKISSAVASFNSAVASLNDADAAAILAMPSLPNGMPSPEQYNAIRAARDADLKRKKQDQLDVINAEKQARIDVEKMRLERADKISAAGSGQRTTSMNTPEQRGMDEFYKSELKAIDENIDMSSDEKRKAKMKLYTEVYGAGPQAPANQPIAIFDPKTGQYTKNDGSVFKNGKPIMSNEPRKPAKLEPAPRTPPPQKPLDDKDKQRLSNFILQK